MTKLMLGAAEHGDLPELGISCLPMRIDTGAATSALHVENLVEFRKGGRKWVSFELVPGRHEVNTHTRITARIKGRKKVKSSSADTQERIVIETLLCLGTHSWPIKLTLADRSEMSYPMLLGREAMQGRVLVDPGAEYLLGKGPGRKKAP